MDGAGAEEERAPKGLGKGRAAEPGRRLSLMTGREAPGNEPNEQPRRRITTLSPPPDYYLCGEPAVRAVAARAGSH